MLHEQAPAPYPAAGCGCTIEHAEEFLETFATEALAGEAGAAVLLAGAIDHLLACTRRAADVMAWYEAHRIDWPSFWERNERTDAA